VPLSNGGREKIHWRNTADLLGLDLEARVHA
jgi:hypothetical protein